MKLEKTQCVYVIFNPDFNITKIGISDNVDKRRKDLEGACGCELLLHYSTEHVFNAIKFEALAHEKLAHKRRIGEWFNATPEEAAEVVKTIVATAVKDPIISAYIQGVTISKIAVDNNVTRQAIIARLKDYGFHNNIENILIVREKGKRWQMYGTYSSPDAKLTDTPASPKEVPQEEIIFLDNIKPKMPLVGLKRIEPNINFNGEWYQVSTYCQGDFKYAYTKDIQKAKMHRDKIK
jgi:hypothetical protein